MIVLVGIWDWFVDKSESWDASDVALVAMAFGVAGFLLLCGLAVVVWSMS